ncbi:Tannase/feruloyl esterase [Aspergillus pseudodeflectus]|uniref:Carboxylic ester hydrolase n=1 Tax=Aspergillus pseudodeflectus TaxID=176178 RepID=A0ABR4KU43_9EURO
MALSFFSPAAPCTAPTFSSISLFGAQILHTTATPVTNYSQANSIISSIPRIAQPPVVVQNASFCNVTVTYTHPGRDDALTAEIWLPSSPASWNGRLQSVGGGGWTAGRSFSSYASMAGAVYEGYTTATTDGGIPPGTGPESWGLVSEGNLNTVALENFGDRSLGDLAVLAKAAIRVYYAQDPLYSYWTGCSNGGRQASILAQQYPSAYDGILAAAPALHWPQIAITRAWPSFYIDLTKQYPRKCEMEALTRFAIAQCDALDGVEDGLISDPEKCRKRFRVREFLGRKIFCSEVGGKIRISAAAVDVTRALLAGPRFANGDFMWFGYEPGTDLSALVVLDPACTGHGGGLCTPASVTDPLTPLSWWNTFVLKNNEANVTSLTHAQYDQLYLTLKKVLVPVAATEPRITEFQRAGGKMLTFHGLADDAITPESTLHYFQEVSSALDNVPDFYRYYRVPGLEHCSGGSGGQPTHLFDQLRAWVENGTAPGASPVTVTLPSNGTMDQLICPYPQKAVYQRGCGRRSSSEGCWKCT